MVAKKLMRCLETDDDIDGEEKMFSSLDEKSCHLLWYLRWNRYASLAELAACIRAETDFEVLHRLHEIINPLAQVCLGHPVAEFHEWEIDPPSGKPVLFHWWYVGEGKTERKKRLVDVLDEDEYLQVLVEVPLGSEYGEIKSEMNNGILKVTFTKRKTEMVESGQ